jgi:hypothetical protein
MGRDFVEGLCVMSATLDPFSLDRMVRAVEKVRERLLRATAALDQGGIPYAVAGGNAVAVWVTRVDESAVRNTRDVDILIRRDDVDAAKNALEAAGFQYKHSAGIDLFLDGPGARPCDAVHLIFAGEKVRAEELLPNPDVTESVRSDRFQVLDLEALVRIKLTAFPDKDRTHLRDLLDVGLIDSAWCAKYPAELVARLQSLIDTPGG